MLSSAYSRAWTQVEPDRRFRTLLTRPESYYLRFVKPCFDRSLAAVLLVVLSPLILLALVLVRATSRGNPIYSQIRLGQGGRLFRIYKIRSMYEDAERGTGARWCVPGDPRVTPIGWILRRTHIDELPQLWNVLKGDLSLVGPRPERPEIAQRIELEIPQFSERLAVKPGITGLAQIQQPPDLEIEDTRRKLALDLAYIETVCASSDLRILLGTVLHVLGLSGRSITRLCQLPSLEEELLETRLDVPETVSA
ncbi:MAG: capsular polysaccharide biosynthesis protein [Isosphaeraceae bacterium]|jgi:lipopolysaccharide/colanic/teichoic acid biosynthesis glycosyltransferase|nr:MAG: capsular polysaccharide biosynthesis protein [Isosphaeraceae bacterium]